MFKAFVKSGTIEDVTEKAGGVKILLRVSSENRDAEGDKFLKSAWVNNDDRNYFLEKGRIDYNHLSDISVHRKSKLNGELAEIEKSRLSAIIGYPEKGENGLFWDESKNGLYSQAILDPNNQYVKSMVSLMKSGFDRFEASAAGVMFHPNGETVTKHGDKTWDRARIQHIAICPPGEAINSDTRVVLMKSVLKDIINTNQVGIDMQTDIDPVTDYIVNSQEYHKSVIGKLTEKLALKLIPCEYEEIRDFFVQHKIPEQEAKQATKLILVKFNEVNV